MVCVISLAGCGEHLSDKLQSGRVMAWDGELGRWAGPVVAADPSCGGPTNGLLSIGKENFGFDPFQSTTVITGKISSDGHMVGTLEREGPDHRLLSINFQAAPDGPDTIRGTLTSSRCHWSVTLHRS
jgi:hypothetical protein